MRWTEEDLVAFHRRQGVTVRTHLIEPPSKPKKVSKYRNIPTTSLGIRFDSKKEAARYEELKLLEKSGEITDLKLQQVFELRVNRQHICKYKADFTYKKSVGLELVVEDVKGKRTREYILKRKLMQACLGITILET